MLSYNKKFAKVSFFLFLFFSFFALGFSFIKPVVAYTSEDMPVGYRPITYADQGKVIGIDLESVFYIDTSITPSSNVIARLSFTSSSSDEPYLVNQYGNVTLWNSDGTRDYLFSSSSWQVDSFSLADGLIINFQSSDGVSAFSFLYVKDYAPVPTLIESILSLFNKLVIWIPSVLTGLLSLFYVSESGLTFLGALAVAGLGISVIFLLIGIIQNFLHFRG